MTVGYRIPGGTDLDSVFAVRVSSPVAATGFKIAGGTDLNQRYEPIGSSTPRANTGFRIAGGTDLALVFKDISAAANTINIDSESAFAVVSFVDALAQYQLTSGGSIRKTTVNNSVNTVGAWISPLTNFSLYSARATLVSGTVLGTMGTWLNLGTTRIWQTGSSGGSVEGVMTVEIRSDSDGIVRDTATITLHAERGDP
jgi:hypothetical protein